MAWTVDTEVEVGGFHSSRGVEEVDQLVADMSRQGAMARRELMAEVVVGNVTVPAHGL